MVQLFAFTFKSNPDPDPCAQLFLSLSSSCWFIASRLLISIEFYFTFEKVFCHLPPRVVQATKFSLSGFEIISNFLLIKHAKKSSRGKVFPPLIVLSITPPDSRIFLFTWDELKVCGWVRTAETLRCWVTRRKQQRRRRNPTGKVDI